MDEQLAKHIARATRALKGLADRIEAEPSDVGDKTPIQAAHAIRDAEKFLEYLALYP